MAKKKIPNLFVLFDTNVLFTQVASDLVRHDVRRIVKDNSNHPDLKISWYLPEVVVGERKHQMLRKAKELLPNMKKLEKLLGHKFGVGEDTLELHVDNAISRGIEEYEFKITNVDVAEVDWNNIISRSVTRDPPFEENEKEKGFRDSIIAHSFAQLHKTSPATPNICRLALVSEDRRLREYVSELTIDSKNVRILSSLDELEGLINTLVSTIPEEFAAELAEKARKLFFEKENEKTFYYKNNVGEKIREQYSKELNETVIPGRHRSGGTWWISNPIFIKKERQRIYWITVVEPEFEIFHYESDEPSPNRLLSLAAAFNSQFSDTGIGSGAARTNIPPPPPTSLGQSLLGQATTHKKVVDLSGKEKFEVHWSASLSQAQNLTAPKLEKIQYMGNNLGESDA